MYIAFFVRILIKMYHKSLFLFLFCYQNEWFFLLPFCAVSGCENDKEKPETTPKKFDEIVSGYKLY